MKNKERIVFVMVGGVMTLLTIIVLGDFWVSLHEHRPIDDDIIHLLQMLLLIILVELVELHQHL